MSFNSSKFQKEFVNFENGIIQIRQELQTLSSKLAKNENKGERNDEDEKIKVKLKSDMDTLLSFIFPETIRILSSISDGVTQFWKEDEVDDDDLVVKMEMELEHDDDRLLEDFQINPDFLENLDEQEEQIEIAEDYDENINGIEAVDVDPLSEDALKLECLTNLPDLRLHRLTKINIPKSQKSANNKEIRKTHPQKRKQNLVPKHDGVKAKQKICRNKIMKPSTNSASHQLTIRRGISRTKITTVNNNDTDSDQGDDDDDDDGDVLKSEPESDDECYLDDPNEVEADDQDDVEPSSKMSKRSKPGNRKPKKSKKVSYTCSANDCSDHFNRKHNYKQHVLVKHPQVYFTLFGPHPLLSKNVTTLEDWLKYVNILEDGTTDEKYPFACIICGRPRKSLSRAMHHAETHHVEKKDKREFSRQCSVCGKLLATSSSLKLHIQTKHPNSEHYPFKCEKCHLGFSSLKRLRSHEQTDTTCISMEEKKNINIQRLSCSMCTKSYKNQKGLKGHIKSHHSTNSIEYKCSHPGCEKIFKETKLLSVHFEGMHSGLEKYHCKIDGCGKKFRWRHSLKSHMNTHKEDDEKLMCSMCPRRFNAQCNLDKHISAVHLQERRFPCTFLNCSKSFKIRAHLKYHLNTHVNPGGRQRGLNRPKEIC